MVSSVRRTFAGITIPQRLLIASALTYGGVFAALLEFHRPGLGVGQGFYLAVILAAAATSPLLGALAGAGALFLYELAIHDQAGLVWSDFAHPSALTRLATYIAVGAVTGFLARRLRLMLSQSLRVLEELADLAYGRIDWAARESEGTQDTSVDRV